MDRDEAYKLLGLYVGATTEHIRSKYEALTGELSGKLQSETDSAARTQTQATLEQLALARDVALGEEAATTTATVPAAQRPQGKRGKYVVIFMAVTMVLIASTSLIGVWVFDRGHEELQAQREKAVAYAARDAWEKYRGALKLPQSTDGKHGMETLADADGNQDNKQAAESYRTATQLFEAALSTENARIGAEWKSEVLQPWKRNLKDRFPFKPKAEQEASLADVAKLFNPVSGSIWKVSREYDALTSAGVGDKQYAVLPDDYSETLRQARALRDALFGDSARVDVPFRFKITEVRPALMEAGVETGGAEAHSRGGRIETARWTPETAGARLYTGRFNGKDRKPDVDLGDSQWGLLQLLNKGKFEGEKNGAYTWRFQVELGTPGRPRTRELSGNLNIMLQREANPFDIALYKAFKPGAVADGKSNSK